MLTMIYGGGDDGADDYGGMHFPILVLFYCSTAIEVRSVQTGQLDGVFMHKRVQAFTFLCERNEKVSLLYQYDTSRYSRKL